jgi:hypothetical protein
VDQHQNEGEVMTANRFASLCVLVVAVFFAVGVIYPPIFFLPLAAFLAACVWLAANDFYASVLEKRP